MSARLSADDEELALDLLTECVLETRRMWHANQLASDLLRRDDSLTRDLDENDKEHLMNRALARSHELAAA
jgi:hypothetical protein